MNRTFQKSKVVFSHSYIAVVVLCIYSLLGITTSFERFHIKLCSKGQLVFSCSYVAVMCIRQFIRYHNAV